MLKRLKGWRKMTWLIWITNAVFLLWIVTGVSSQPKPHCQGLSQKTCQDAANVGTGIGVFLIVVLWLVVFFVEAIVWFMTRPKEKVVYVERSAPQA